MPLTQLGGDGREAELVYYAALARGFDSATGAVPPSLSGFLHLALTFPSSDGSTLGRPEGAVLGLRRALAGGSHRR